VIFVIVSCTYRLVVCETRVLCRVDVVYRITSYNLSAKDTPPCRDRLTAADSDSDDCEMTGDISIRFHFRPTSIDGPLLRVEFVEEITRAKAVGDAM